ncbi:MAG: peptide synthase, partial [Desulfuromonadales bacterium]|nr:peptide synthase [Desulfuromonadales bacterium]
ALVGVGVSGKIRPVLCVELEKGVEKTEHVQILAELRQIGQTHELTKSIQDILFHPSFPVDIRHNAKIFREKLAVWAEEQLK